MALIPNNQIEAILAGEDVTATSREQAFLEQSVRGGIGHLRVTFTITTVESEKRVTANKTPDQVRAAMEAGTIVDAVDKSGNYLILSSTEPNVVFYQLAVPATFKIQSSGTSWVYWDVA